MKTKHILYLILLGTAVACSNTDEETLSSPEDPASTRSVYFLSETVTDYTISAFREGNNGFAFLKTFPSSGRADGQTEIQLPVGNYQFLVASGYGTNTTQQPKNPVQATTLFGDMRFVAQPATDNPANILPAEELFLQDTGVDSIYSLYTAETIQINLKRSVAQVILFIKRGQKAGDNQFEPLPYQQDSILRYFSAVELQLENIGTSVDLHSLSDGAAAMTVSYPATAYDSITTEGFATFTGPFFFPPKGNELLRFHVKLHPATGSPQPELTLTTSGKVGRNERLIVTAWITSDWNFIGLTADTQPITAEIPGEDGIWGDIVTPSL